ALWAFGGPWEGGGEDLRLGQLHLDLDLDRRGQRQHRDAHRAARVDALVAEDLGQQLTGTVDDAGLAREVRGGGHEADHLHHACDTVQVTGDGLDGGQGVQRTRARQVLR